VSSRLSVLLVTAVLSLVSACSGDPPPEPEIRPVRVLTVDTRVAGQSVSLVGTVQAENEINQSFRIDGRIIERTVNVGDTVRAGQLIARLDSQNEETSLNAARAQLAAARAQFIEADNHFVRMRDLIAENAVSRSQFDQAEANRTAASSQVESAQAQVTLASNRLGYTRLESSASGVVTFQGAEPGEVVAAGRTIVQVAREGARDAVFDVPAAIKDSAPENARITVALTGAPDVRAEGRVREVAPRADAVTGTFRIRIALIDPPAAMRLGTTVTGSMKLTDAAGIEIPAVAVTRSGGRPSVWVVNPADGSVTSRDIGIGSSNPERVVVSSGLDPGDVIVIAGVHALRPGQKVRALGTGK